MEHGYMTVLNCSVSSRGNQNTTQEMTLNEPISARFLPIFFLNSGYSNKDKLKIL
jgi:hypothetical protein